MSQNRSSTPIETEYNQLFDLVQKAVSDGKTSDGGGGSGLEARVAKIESDLGHIKTNVSEIKSELKDIRKDAREDFKGVQSEIKAMNRNFIITIITTAALCVAGVLQLVDTVSKVP